MFDVRPTSSAIIPRESVLCLGVWRNFLFFRGLWEWGSSLARVKKALIWSLGADILQTYFRIGHGVAGTILIIPWGWVRIMVAAKPADLGICTSRSCD